MLSPQANCKLQNLVDAAFGRDASCNLQFLSVTRSRYRDAQDDALGSPL
jgi:hypothetical protein